MKHLMAIGLTLVFAHGLGAEEPGIKSRFKQEAVKRGPMKAVVTGTGWLMPEELADIGPQVAGTIKQLGVDPNNKKKPISFNSVVKKGMALAEIDSAIYAVKLDKAKADLQFAEAVLQQAKVRVDVADRGLQRAKKRQTDKTATADEVAAAQEALDLAKAAIPVEEAKIAQAKASVAQAKIELEYTTIRCPGDGIVIDQKVNVGQTVVASLEAPPLFLIAKGDLKKMQVWAAVTEAEIANVQEGQAVTFAVPAYPKESFKGRVMGVRLNARDKEKPPPVFYTVVVDVENADLKLLPYMTAKVSIPVGERTNVLQVPNAALQWRPKVTMVAEEERGAFKKWMVTTGHPYLYYDDPVVFVEDEGYVRMIRVSVGATDGTYSEIVSGDLKAGTKVVTGLVDEMNVDPKK
jgi:HlyD family secretion protein